MYILHASVVYRYHCLHSLHARMHVCTYVQMHCYHPGPSKIKSNAYIYTAAVREAMDIGNVLCTSDIIQEALCS